MSTKTIVFFDNIRHFLFTHLSHDGNVNKILVEIILLAGVALTAFAFYYIAKSLLRLLAHVVEKTDTEWDNDLLCGKMLGAIAQLSPALLVNWMLPAVFRGYLQDVKWLTCCTSLYIIGTVVWILWVFIGNLHDAFEKREELKNYAVKGVFQMIKLLVLAVGIIISISIIIGKSPLVILTALGASAAILILIFQDTILGLVVSVQFTANNMLKKGDWIEDKTHDVSGEVIEITLSAVKIQNWDNSISCVPPNLLLKNSFRNYQPMRESGGRRVDRAIYIDMNSVAFCSAEQIQSLTSRHLINEENTDVGSPTGIINITLLRHYLEGYLSNHPAVRSDMLLMIRQLKPTNAGLPLELYFFVRAVEWDEYERTVCDIFDHVYAVVREFGLSIFQTPAGTDLSRISAAQGSYIKVPTEKEIAYSND